MLMIVEMLVYEYIIDGKTKRRCLSTVLVPKHRLSFYLIKYPLQPR